MGVVHGDIAYSLRNARVGFEVAVLKAWKLMVMIVIKSAMPPARRKTPAPMLMR